MALDPLTAAFEIGSKVIERLWPDQTQQDVAKLELLKMQRTGELSEFMAAADIVKTEAQSDSWLASSWRPILMLTFGALIVARWFGWGPEPPGDQSASVTQ